jgi:hypothetical protein
VVQVVSAPVSKLGIQAPRRAADDPTADSARLVYDEMCGTADFIQSYAIGFLEAAKRGDRVRVHGYINDIVRCSNEAREAYERIAALATLGCGK